MKQLCRMFEIVAWLLFGLAVLFMVAKPAMAADAVTGDVARAGAVEDCMKYGKDGVSQKDCMQGLALITAIEALREVAMRGGGGAGLSQAQQPVIIQANGKTAWDVFAGMVTGVAQFAKDAFQTVAPVAAQVYNTRTNARVQETVARINGETEQVRVNATERMFTSATGAVRDAGIAGYPYVQAPGTQYNNGSGGYMTIGNSSPINHDANNPVTQPPVVVVTPVVPAP